MMGFSFHLEKCGTSTYQKCTKIHVHVLKFEIVLFRVRLFENM